MELAVEAGLDEAQAAAVLADTSAYAEDVRKDEQEAQMFGATGVPFFVIDRKYGISGGQPVDVFANALDEAWKTFTPPVKLVGLGGPAGTDGAEVCRPEGCEVPQS